MEAARVTAARGHQVWRYEKKKRLGGQLVLACMLREENEALVKYLSNQMKKLGVKVELGKKVDSALIAEIKPDVIVVATGAGPGVPDIPGIEGDNVLSGADIYEMMQGRAGGGDGKKSVSGRRFIWYLGVSLMKTPLGYAVTKRVLRTWAPFG